jgi:hypothetical protein
MALDSKLTKHDRKPFTITWYLGFFLLGCFFLYRGYDKILAGENVSNYLQLLLGGLVALFSLIQMFRCKRGSKIL